MFALICCFQVRGEAIRTHRHVHPPEVWSNMQTCQDPLGPISMSILQRYAPTCKRVGIYSLRMSAYIHVYPACMCQHLHTSAYMHVCSACMCQHLRTSAYIHVYPACMCQHLRTSAYIHVCSACMCQHLRTSAYITVCSA